MRVTSPDHVPFNRDVTMVPEDGVRTVDVLLERGVVQEIEVVTPSGQPIANATILEGVQADGYNPQFIDRVDARGRLGVRGQPGQSRVLYVLPQPGSFAVVRLRLPMSGADAKPLPVIVPPPVGSIHVKVVDAEGKPTPGHVRYRYNGELVPYMVVSRIGSERPMNIGLGEFVLPRLPAGTYELWALERYEEEAALFAGGGTSRRRCGSGSPAAKRP